MDLQARAMAMATGAGGGGGGGELLGEEGAAPAEHVPVHAHPHRDPFLAVQHHRHVARLRLPEPHADLVPLRLRLRRRRLRRRLVGSVAGDRLAQDRGGPRRRRGWGRRLVLLRRRRRRRRLVVAAAAVVVGVVLEALVERRRRRAAPESLRRDGDRHGPHPRRGIHPLRPRLLH
ncbi:Os12g0596501, partial [Oryza sativa Japonica Group]